MQESCEIVSSSGGYKVISDAGLLSCVVSTYPDAVYLVDERLSGFLPTSIEKLVLVEATESKKSLECIPDVIQAMRNLGVNRSTHLVAIGGGVIQDIATFSASIYMRGISWSYMPTTMLGMADSCIGGKSSINVGGYKNLIGNIYPPREVFIDVDFIQSLDAEKIVGGLFEAAKICYARGYQKFLDYISEGPVANMERDCAQRVIMRSLRTKKWFIEVDEFDQNERLLLNFGHTFGHAIEAGTQFEVAHGIAVGAGMLVAIEYAQKRNLLNQTGLDNAQHLATHICMLFGDGATSIGRPKREICLGKVMEKFAMDKKHRSDFYRMVVPISDGGLQLISEPHSPDVSDAIVRAYQAALGHIGWKIDNTASAIGVSQRL